MTGPRLPRRLAIEALTLPAAAHGMTPPARLEIAAMTWIEVRDAIAAGYRTVLVPSGGIEQNGPRMILGKDGHAVWHAARGIAAALGDALAAPLLPYAPQGRFAPPEGRLRFAGTLGVSEEAFAGMLDGIARSLRLAGFRFICLLADHGGSQRPQAAFAARLSAEWQRASIRVFGPERFDGAIAEQDAWLMRQGETRESIGTHAGIGDTSELPAVHPAGVDLARLPADRAAAVALGASGDPGRASAARGERLLAMRIAAAIAEIRAARGYGPPPLRRPPGAPMLRARPVEDAMPIDENLPFLPVQIAVLTVSDTRDFSSDRSGQALQERIEARGHRCVAREIVKDEADAIEAVLRRWIADPAIDCVISTGGTGLTGRDVTPEAFRRVIEKEIEGFGELFRMLSYQKIGTSTMQSRALAGVAGGTYLFALPGSTGACKDAWDDILQWQLDSRHRPCNLVELMPRLKEHLKAA